MSLFLIFIGLVMAGSFAGMIYCVKKQQTSPAAVPTAVALIAVMLISMVIVLAHFGFFGDSTGTDIEKTESYFIKCRGLISGRFIAENIPNSKALLVVDKDAENNEIIIPALKKSLEGKVQIAAEDNPMPVAIPQEGGSQNPAAPAPLAAGPRPAALGIAKTMRAADFDAMIKRHPDCNLIISLVGLPMDVENMEVWYAQENPEAPKPPRFALLEGDVSKLKNAILSGVIICAVIENPTAILGEKDAPSDPQKAFDKRYVILTKDNIEDFSRHNPIMFQ